jgi:Xaa-Pro aminopeptidase
MRFETLTLAPIDRNLVEPSLLEDEEIDWLDAYHAEIRDVLTPLVDPDTAQWLAAVTQPIPRLLHPAAVRTIAFSAATERRPG